MIALFCAFRFSTFELGIADECRWLMEMDQIDWLDPWWSVSDQGEDFCEAFRAQLEREVSPGHPLYSLPVKLMARGTGDDALFLLLDGTGRVAQVHLTWSQKPQQPPWPATAIFVTAAEWREKVMLPEHKLWSEG